METPPGYVRLTIRAQDLDTFRWACDLCMEPAALSPRGDGVVLEARNATDPRSTTIVAHRAYLLGALHADSFERARVALLGVEPDSSHPSSADLEDFVLIKRDKGTNSSRSSHGLLEIRA